MNHSLSPARRTAISTLAVLFFFFFSGISSFAQQVSLPQLKPLQFRHIGPVGNRVISIAGISGNPLVYYAGAAARPTTRAAPPFPTAPTRSISSPTTSSPASTAARR